MRGSKLGMSGVLMMVGIVAAAGVARCEEPALNIQPPAAAPIQEGATPGVSTNTPAVTNALAEVAVTNIPSEVAATNAVSIPTVTNVPPEIAKAPEGGESAAWKAASWQIGTRYTEVKLQDNKRGTPGNGSFFGTITQINEEQDGFPNKAYLQYRLFKSPVWIGVSYDHVRASTMDDLSLVPDGSGSDGSEELQGVIPYLHAAWDNTTRFAPYVQAGIGFYQAKFLPNSWGDNRQRFVEAKSNVTGVELAGGLNVRLYKNISADIFAKYMKIDDITGDWFYNYGNNYGGPFIMTMSYVAYGAGLNWRF